MHPRSAASALQPPPANEALEGRPSVLFGRIDETPPLSEEPPASFADLNLDQVVEAITAGRDEYHLEPFFFTPLSSVAGVEFRHEVLRDLEEEEPRDSIERFAQGMRAVRRRLAQRDELRHSSQQKAWFLSAANKYCETVATLAEGLRDAEIGSPGLLSLADYLDAYVQSDRFAGLVHDAHSARERLAGIRYRLHIKGGRITVSAYEHEPAYTEKVEATFEKFRQGEARDYRSRFPDPPAMNHVEEAILDLVVQLCSDEFAELDSFCERHAAFVDEIVVTFDREVQFYLAFLEHRDRLREVGLECAYPEIADGPREIRARGAFDIALAGTLLGASRAPILNDFALADPEQILVVTGPNHGGKTTFARMFGQLHDLAAIGLPVPAREAKLGLCDGLHTHFEKEEDLATGSGKLQDDLERIHGIVERVTSRSVVVMNESLTSTTVEDARRLGQVVLEELIDRGVRGVYVTFIDELAQLSDATVSMVATVPPDDPAGRTYRVVRRPPDGRAYALAIADKYGLSYEQLKGRLGS